MSPNTEYVSIDVEADGPVPYLYSMISFGAVFVSDPTKTFYAELRPVSQSFDPKALEVTGFSRGETMEFELPVAVMPRFSQWLRDNNPDKARLIFMSDNAGFDWQFMNYYFHLYVGKNPFGFSPMSLTWLYKGITRDARKSFKHLRKTKHTHNALDDAQGNVEALRAIIENGWMKL